MEKYDVSLEGEEEGEGVVVQEGGGCQGKNFFFIQANLGFPLLMHLCALLMSTQVRNPIN